ncbi:hypothetical protein Y032_0018g3504 [Ancylostoma ceylanicum]|uniref:Uncharacterized protein n=1 Tax=Ancylostoma ceylanicum TaxID=53326 RepID=A0A016V2Q5_9BILA|nr:hypothetical protein Y032_0018g3504 [Ancylostoma ceylanicum]
MPRFRDSRTWKLLEGTELIAKHFVLLFSKIEILIYPTILKDKVLMPRKRGPLCASTLMHAAIGSAARSPLKSVLLA